WHSYKEGLVLYHYQNIHTVLFLNRMPKEVYSEATYKKIHVSFFSPFHLQYIKFATRFQAFCTKILPIYRRFYLFANPVAERGKICYNKRRLPREAPFKLHQHRL